MPNSQKPTYPIKETGDLGEAIACRYLQDKGFQIIERNFRLRIGELDIIAKDGNCLVFCEVRTLRDPRGFAPEHSITIKKRKQLSRIANGFLSIRKMAPKFCRFDVVAIILTDNNTKINHIPNAFEPIL